MLSLLQQTAPAAVTETTQTVVQTPGQDGHAVTTTTETETVTILPADGVAGVDHSGHTAMTEVPEHGGAGMPQLDFSTYGNQIFWLLIALVVIFLILSRVALPRIGRILADRQGLMTGDLMAAEEFKQKAKEAEAAYDKALSDARAEAQKIVAANKAEIDAELKAAMAKADAEISARAAESEKRIQEIRVSAVDDARSVAQDVAAELVGRFGVSADNAALADAVEARMKGTQQ